MHESSFTEMEVQQILEAEQEIMSSLSCMQGLPARGSSQDAE